jgi:hypothetical protein
VGDVVVEEVDHWEQIFASVRHLRPPLRVRYGFRVLEFRHYGMPPATIGFRV